jgi:hypothetical protein
MSASDYWARQFGSVTPPSVPTQPVSYPQKAVRWEPGYPPTGPRTQEVAADQLGGMPEDNWNRVQHQGYVAKPPTSAGKLGACPECGGSSFFKRKGPMGVEAAPLCTDCGYNGDYFVQSGTLLNAIGMKSSTPIQFARSDNPEAQSRLWSDPGVGSDFSWGNVGG